MKLVQIIKVGINKGLRFFAPETKILTLLLSILITSLLSLNKSSLLGSIIWSLPQKSSSRVHLNFSKNRHHQNRTAKSFLTEQNKFRILTFLKFSGLMTNRTKTWWTFKTDLTQQLTCRYLMRSLRTLIRSSRDQFKNLHILSKTKKSYQIKCFSLSPKEPISWSNWRSSNDSWAIS